MQHPGFFERGGPFLLQVIADNVAKDAEAIMTDENPAYNFKTTQFRNVRHERIKHKEKI